MTISSHRVAGSLSAVLLIVLGAVLGAAPVAAATLSVETITALATTATADNTYEHGWKWVFAVTVPDDETLLKMKFADWTSGENTLATAGNVRYYSAQSTNAASSATAFTLSQGGAYPSEALTLDPAADLDPLALGRQIEIVVEVKIPTGTPNGSYTTNYGIRTDAVVTPPTTEEKLSISASADNPQASILEVKTDQVSDWYTVFAFELDAEEADIALDTIEIVLETSEAPALQVVNDAKLVIDGEEFNDFTWSTEGSASSTIFAINKTFTVNEGATATVEYLVQFKTQNGNYGTGEAILASTEGGLIIGEGSAALTADGSAVGSTHLLAAPNIAVEPAGDSAQVTIVDGADNDYATFEIEVDIEALGSDIFISQSAANAFTFRFENASNGSVLAASTAATAVVSSSAETQDSAYRVNEGETESFTFTVTLDPLPANESASYRMQLLTINFGTSAGSATANAWTATPAQDYETSGIFIAD